jgi:tRNA(Phe) wybutosine-synthesizing methylase Tyw3
VDAWDLCNISFKDVVVLLNDSFMDTVNDSIMCIISLNCLPVTKSSSSSSRSCCGRCFLASMVSGIEKRSSRCLGVSKEEPKVGGITHSLKRLTPLLRVFYLCYRWQLVVVKVTRRSWGDCKVNPCCSREGVAWKVNYGG